MDYSPIVLQRKPHVPLGGSSNPFDDFDILGAQQPGNAAFLGSPLLSASSYNREADSDDTFFDMFFDNSPKLGSMTSPSRAIQPSTLRKEVRAFNADEDDDDDDETAMEAAEARENAEQSAPSIPARVSIPPDWLQKIREPKIPFDKDDAALYNFMLSPLDSGCAMRMTLQLNPATRQFKLIHDSTNRIVLIAARRTDGLKSLAFSSNYSILMMPTDAALEAEPTASRASSLAEPVRIAKLRSNAMCSQYSLFDQGKSPSKAAGILEMRRELMSVRFEIVQKIFTRRSVLCTVPMANAMRRPTSKEETLHERAKKLDPSVISLSPFHPVSQRLPRFEDFGGFAKTPSIKNIMLHDPKSKKVVFRMGRVDSSDFLLEFGGPMSVVSAFALGIASIDSKVHPNRQF